MKFLSQLITYRPIHLSRTAASRFRFLILLLVTFHVLLIFPSCKTSIVPPDKWPPSVDTTSHNFLWRIDTLGDGNSSMLNDVFIIDENNIWAVGEIYLKDTAGQFIYPPFNAAKWNGISWELKQITVIYNGNPVTAPLQGVFAFSPTDIWVTNGFPVHGNGSSWTMYHLQDMGLGVSVSRVWGTSSSNLYFVGRQGSITHYDGSSWQKLESATTVDIQDIWGAVDPQTGNSLILCASSFVFQQAEMKILRISITNVVDTIPWGTGRRVHSVWFQSSKKLFASGGGVFVQQENRGWNEVTDLPLTYTRRVRGNAENDLFVVGDFGYVAHYNGSSWRYYTGQELPSFNGLWNSVAVTGNKVVAVGLVDDRAIVLSGIRN